MGRQASLVKPFSPSLRRSCDRPGTVRLVHRAFPDGVLTLLCRSARLSSPLKVLRPLLHYLTGLSTASAKAFIPSLLARLDAGGLEDRDTPVFDAGQGVAEKLEQTLWADQEVEVVRLKEAIARAVVVR